MLYVSVRGPEDPWTYLYTFLTLSLKRPGLFTLTYQLFFFFFGRSMFGGFCLYLTVDGKEGGSEGNDL